MRVSPPSVMAPPCSTVVERVLLPSSILLSCLLRFGTLLRTLCARTLARTWSATAAGPLAVPAPPWHLEHRRGSFASAELGQDGLGRSPEPGRRPPLRSVCTGQMWPWASCFPRAGPVVIGKLRFQFSFIIWREKCFGKCLYTQICSKFVETNFARFLVTRST